MAANPTNLKIDKKNQAGVIHKKAIHVPSGDIAVVSQKLHGGNVKKGN